MTTATLNAPGPSEAEAFTAFCGCDPRSLRPEVRLTMVRRFQAHQKNATAPSPVAKFQRECQIKHGLDEFAWPAQDRARLDLLRQAASPKPAPPIQPLTPAEKVRADALAARNKLQADAEAIARSAARDGANAGLNVMVARQRELDKLTKRIAEIETLHGL
jgi:hypothetical protein